MRKLFLMSLIGLMALVLAACGSSESAEDIYTKALDAAEDMESAEATMDMQQTMDFGDEGSMDMDSSYDMKMTMDPLAMHMDGTTSMGGGDDDDNDADAMQGLGMDMDMEIYLVDSTMYMYNDMIGQWLKMDGAEMDMIEEMAGQQPDPAEQMEIFEDYTDNLSFEESDDAYVLTLDADGDDFDDLFQDLIDENMSTEMLDEMGGEDMLEDTEVNSMSLEIGIDKDSYEMKTYDIDMDMTMEIEGEEMNIVQKVESEYSNINGVDAIEVPDDVKDEAVDQSEMGL